MMTAIPVLGSIVTANYITMTLKALSTEVKANICCLLSQEVHNNMPRFPSEETLLMTARILRGSVTAQLQSQPGNQNSLVPAWSLTKEQRDIDLWSLSGLNRLSGSEQTKVVVTARAMGDICC